MPSKPRLSNVLSDSVKVNAGTEVVVKSHGGDSRLRHILKTKSLNGPSTARQIERTPVTVVKTLPSRNIVKSLPAKPPPNAVTTTRYDLRLIHICN